MHDGMQDVNCETYSMRLRRASSPSFSMTSLVLLGLMLRTSSGSYSSSPGAISTRGLSLGMIMVPLLFRLPSLGLDSRPRVGRLSSVDDVVDSGGDGEFEAGWMVVCGIRGGELRASTGVESVTELKFSEVILLWRLCLVGGKRVRHSVCSFQSESADRSQGELK